MELLAEITDEDIGFKKSFRKGEHKAIRDKGTNNRDHYRGATRGVVLNAKKEMALLHATKYNYYKLPGGGIERGESTINALHREIMEELGCRITELKPVGLIIEHRNRIKETQISYCYLAKLKGKPGKTNLEEGEKKEGFETEWWGMSKALDLVKNKNNGYYLVRFMAKRDAIFIKRAMKLVSGKKAL